MVASRIISLLSNSRHAFRKSKMDSSTIGLNGLLRKKWHVGPIQSVRFSMSDNFEAELNDPKRHLDYDGLVERREKNNAVVIDVREHSEINETGKIPGSIHIPLGELKKALGEMSPDDFKKNYKAEKPQKDTEIIFSCKAGIRSFKALRLGLELGYSKAENFKGGWLEWAEKNQNQN